MPGRLRALLVPLLLVACSDATSVDPTTRVHEVLVEPGDVEVAVGGRGVLTANAFNAAGDPVRTSKFVEWESWRDDVVSVSATGRLQGVGFGSAVVTATVDGVVGRARVRVVDVPVASLEVGPESAGILSGDTLRLSATPRDSAGTVLEGRRVRWASSDEDILDVDEDGLVRGLARGAALVTASIAGYQASSSVAVDWASVASVDVSPDTASLVVGEERAVEAVARDSAGNAMPGRLVVWSVEDSNVARIDDGGRVFGLDRGTTRIQAVIGGVAGSALVVVEVGGNPSITDISPSPLVAGEVGRIRGHNLFGAGGTEVRLAGLSGEVLNVAGDQVEFQVPMGDGPRCVPSEAVEVDVTVRGGDGARRAVREHAFARAPQAHLDVGERVDSNDMREGCVEISDPDGAYLLSATHWGEAPSATTGFEIRGRGGVRDVAATTSVAAPLSASSSSSDSHHHHGTPGDHAAHALHASLLEDGRALAARLPPARRSAPREGGLFSLGASQSVSAGGSVPLRIPRFEDLCDYRDVTARVVYVGERSVVLEDSANRTAGGVDDLYRAIGEEFDRDQYPLLREYFGDPLAYNDHLNQDGKVYMLFTDVVTEMGGGGLNGFVTTGDFLDRSDCQSSDEMEIFYARSPNDVSSASSWHRSIRSTVVHEVKHLTSYAERFSRSATDREEVWLEEATAMLAEEIWARTQYGYGRYDRTGYDESLFCELRGDEAGPCEGSPRAMLDHYAFLDRYYADMERRTPLGGVTGGDFTWYGSAWALVRYALDAYAVDEASALRSMTQSRDRFGIRNLVDQVPTDYRTLLSDFSFASYLAHTGRGVGDRHDFPTWNIRDVFRGLHWDVAPGGFFSREFPLAPRTVSKGDFSVDVTDLRAGTSSLIRLGGSTSGTQLVEFSGIDGRPPSDRLDLVIMRID